MKVKAYLRLVRLKFILVACTLTLFLCIYTGKELHFTIPMVLASITGVSAVMAICELNDRNIDKIKYERFEFYRKGYNPLVTGEITVDECSRFIFIMFLFTIFIGVYVGFFYNWLNVALALLALNAGLVYILINRTLIGNIFQGLSYFIAVFAVSYPSISSDIVFLAWGITFYCISHNIANQIQDYEFEVGIEKTIATVYGKRKARVIGLTLLSLSFPWLYVCSLFILPMLVLGVVYLVDRKEVQDVLRTINYILLAICFISLIL